MVVSKVYLRKFRQALGQAAVMVANIESTLPFL